MGQTFKGEDDRITDEALDILLRLSEKLPDEFDVGTIQAHQRSVTVTLYFPAADPMTQSEFLDTVLTASIVMGALARNLKHERSAGGV